MLITNIDMRLRFLRVYQGMRGRRGVKNHLGLHFLGIDLRKRQLHFPSCPMLTIKTHQTMKRTRRPKPTQIMAMLSSVHCDATPLARVRGTKINATLATRRQEPMRSYSWKSWSMTLVCGGRRGTFGLRRTRRCQENKMAMKGIARTVFMTMPINQHLKMMEHSNGS